MKRSIILCLVFMLTTIAHDKSTQSSAIAQSQTRDTPDTPQTTEEPETNADDTTGDDENLIVLFDGTNLDAWRGYRTEAIGDGWSIDGEALHFDGSRGSGDICTVDEYEHFELCFEWKVTDSANSGVMYRVTMGDGAPYYSGVEYQILDDEGHADGATATTSAAALYALYEADGKELSAIGQWNTAKIVHRGNHVEHWLNGVRVVSAEIGSDNWNERVAASKFHDWEKFGVSPRGRIALQDHGDEVWFRNITLRLLDPPAEAPATDDP